MFVLVGINYTLRMPMDVLIKVLFIFQLAFLVIQ